MDAHQLLIDLHRSASRLGPGADEATRLAIKLAGLQERQGLVLADVGCGTGAATLALANALDASIMAVDVVPGFLAELTAAAAQAQLGHRIEPLEASMTELPFADRSLDAIWSEGAIYNMGFVAGISSWRRFLKPDGVLAVSELTWLTEERPAELTEYWLREYPEVDTASAKLAQLEQHGFSPLGYFPLATDCWLDNYYRPLQALMPDFLSRHGHSKAAAAVVAATEREIELYERYSAFVSYGFFIAQRVNTEVEPN